MSSARGFSSPSLSGPDDPCVRVLIADGHDVIRRGLRNLVDSHANYRVVADTPDGREALRLAKQLNPDVAIVDYMLPGFNGVNLSHAFKRAGLRTHVVIYTMHITLDAISTALRLGVQGFVLKSDPDDTLVAALEAVAAGSKHLSAAVSDVLLPSILEPGAGASGNPLTHRERHVIQLIGEGHGNKQAGRHLGISSKTVETHRARAMRKLGVKTTAGLVRWAIRNHLVQA